MTPAEIKSGAEKAAEWVNQQRLYQQDTSGYQPNGSYQIPANQKRHRFTNRMLGVNTASPSVVGIQPQNMTNQGVSLGTNGQHNPALALQQNEQVQQFSQIGLSSTAANDHAQAVPTTVQFNPAPTFQQNEKGFNLCSKTDMSFSL